MKMIERIKVILKEESVNKLLRYTWEKIWFSFYDNRNYTLFIHKLDNIPDSSLEGFRTFGVKGYLGSLQKEVDLISTSFSRYAKGAPALILLTKEGEVAGIGFYATNKKEKGFIPSIPIRLNWETQGFTGVGYIIAKFRRQG